ncbi:MAG: hypothetical protein M3Q69_07905 [Acidobacteriota bacterium]|nr:hypothetical protein [Acidobacteriota bacterium]
MNYDLAMMALEGLARAPLALRQENGEIVLEADAASFKELARLCLLLGGTQGGNEEFALTPGVHVERDALGLRLKLKS